MNYEVINTGSDGNCIVLNENIMLDCGIGYARIKKHLKNIKIVFISHVHADHLKQSTVKKIAFEYPNIKFIVGEQLVDTLLQCNVSKKNIFILKLNTWYDIGICKVKLDYLYHDVPNYALHIEIKDFKILYATDTGKIDHIIANNYDFAFIEANYETKEVLEEQIRIAHEKGEYTHLERVKYTHLSQLDAINWLQKNNITNYCFIHEHKEKEEENEKFSHTKR